MADLSSLRVDVTGLFVLSRRLMQIAESALPQRQGATSLRLILIDVAYHRDGSSITDITARTGFPQSLVSMSVSRLREIGVIETEPDPADRRRTLVRPTPRMMELAEGVGGESLRSVLAEQLDGASPGQIDDALDALELLGRLFAPEVISTES